MRSAILFWAKEHKKSNFYEELISNYIAVYENNSEC